MAMANTTTTTTTTTTKRLEINFPTLVKKQEGFCTEGKSHCRILSRFTESYVDRTSDIQILPRITRKRKSLVLSLKHKGNLGVPYRTANFNTEYFRILPSVGTEFPQPTLLKWRSRDGAELQTERFQVRFPIVSLRFITDINLPAILWPQGDTVPSRNEHGDYFLRG
jgi:hypothetical protein